LSLVAAFFGTNPCDDALHRKFKQDNNILRCRAAQLARKGVLSPKTRFATKLALAT